MICNGQSNLKRIVLWGSASPQSCPRVFYRRGQKAEELGKEVGAMNRANSCQSDSSGFLEEPEPAPLQMPSLPGSQRQAGDRCPTPRQQSPSRGSPQDWQQESDESDSRSMMSASFSSQDWSALEEKVSTPVAESGAPLENAGGSVEPLNPEKVGYKTTRAGDGARTDAWARAGPRVAAGTVTASRAWPLAFTSGRAAEVKDVGVRPEGTADVRKPSQRCPDLDNTSVTLEGPPQRALKPSDITPSRADVIQTSDKAIPGSETLAEVFPQEKPRCSALTPETPSSGSGVRNLPPGADSRSGSSRCVTTQPAPQLPSAARTAEAPGTAKGRTSERTECEPMTTGPGQGREAKQFRDASVQTYQCEPRPWHCRWAHTAQPLDKSISLGMGFPALRPEGTCYPAHAHCCSCCRRCPHCPSERREPRPAPSACVHCACSHHGHPEAQFTKMLEILQEIVVTELSSCTIHEMEVMKTLCRAFRTHLEEIEAHLTGQQTLFSRDMTEEEREEAQQLQTLREALRQQVEELEFQLGDRAQQIRQSILLVQEQFELLTGKTPEHCPNPHQLNWTGARNAPTAFPPEDRQQASRSDTTLLADLPPSALGSSPGMSPPAQAESGPTPLSDCTVGGKGMNVFL
ncbi:Protein ITPRID1 [Galemys pyrenaicus]|uniref:Protein ITPRID1 n=1 Tax=Galemys pyrenaicus TaxID=202257 RepID=A0A8J6DEJ5_GALPY|nr:Protein ITPRID1 [Galemys pyrenaicus]